MTDKCEFKSAKELGLKQNEWEALIKTLTLMEADAIVHLPLESYEFKVSNSQTKPIFSMSEWHAKYPCGTVACIGGSAEIFGNLKMHTMQIAANRIAAAANNDRNLFGLFYKWGNRDPTPTQAAKVLRHYLATGRTVWSHADR